jgi:uncharacterized protein YcnI
MIRTRVPPLHNHQPTRRRYARAVAVALIAALVPTFLLAHAVVYPGTSSAGAYERYELRVPNEKNLATVRVELRFPDSVRVIGFEDVLGWRLQVQRDSAKRIVGAVWTGVLAPERFVEFPFIVVNPRHAATLVWPAYQTYADGERVEWTGAEGSTTPASVSVVRADSGTASAGGRGGSTIEWVAIAASLVLSLIALGIAGRRNTTD